MPRGWKFTTDIVDHVRQMRSVGNGVGGKAGVFLGIFCRSEDVMARTVIRETMLQIVPEGITVKFVICHSFADELDLLWTELRAHDDIYLLDCEENMNGGKTFQYFATVRETFPHHLYYAKSDTDSYLLLPALVSALSQAPDDRFYGGRCNGEEQGVMYMSGSFYVLSHHLVTLLESCGSTCFKLSVDGPEDMQTGRMLEHLVGNDFILGDLGPHHSILYDRDPEDAPIHADIVYVHDVKTVKRWQQVHRQFVQVLDVASMEGSGVRYWDGPSTTPSLYN